MTQGLVRIRVARNLNASSAFAEKLKRQGAKRLARRLEQIGADAVRRCDVIVSAELVNDRLPERRRGGRHLLGSFRYEVVWDNVSFPVSLRLYSLANPAKVNAMESGADPHRIAAVNATFLSFPRGGRSSTVGILGDTKLSTSRGRPQIRQGYRGRSTGTAMTRLKSVEHPGNLPHSMMERALNAAVEAALSGARL
jgi:hypothetical protein